MAAQSVCYALAIHAYLTIIMDTQFYNGKLHAYEDFSIHDVLHMVGRANRPKLDNDGLSFFDSFCDFYALRLQYCKTSINLFMDRCDVPTN